MILEDRQLHINSDLKAKNEYTFKSLKTDDQSRFILHFATIKSPSNIELPAAVYQDGDQLIIDLTSINLETETRVYDIIGRQLIQKKLPGETRNSINVNSKTQLLIVVLNNKEGMLCRKIMWINK